MKLHALLAAGLGLLLSCSTPAFANGLIRDGVGAVSTGRGGTNIAHSDNGAILLDNVVTEDFVMIGAGSLVPPGKELKTGGLYVGSPVKRMRDLTEKEIAFLTYSAAHYVKVKDEYLKA